MPCLRRPPRSHPLCRPGAETGPTRQRPRPGGRRHSCCRTPPDRPRMPYPSPPPKKRRPILSVSLHGTNQCRRGTMILHILETETPDDVVVRLRHIELGIAVLVVTMTLTAGRLAAAIAIGNQIGLVVVGIDAG